MKLFNWESFKKTSHQEKPLTDEEIDEKNNPIHEEKDRKNFQTKDLQTENFQPEVFEEEQRLTENDPEKKFIPIEEIAEQKLDVDGNIIDVETYYNEQIDHPKPKYKEYDERKSSNRIQLSPELDDIKQKHSLPKTEWDSLTPEEQKAKKAARITDTNELYVRQPKKMVRKKIDKEIAT